MAQLTLITVPLQWGPDDNTSAVNDDTKRGMAIVSEAPLESGSCEIVKVMLK